MFQSYTYKLDGLAGTLSSDSNCLTIVWAKDFDEISYHHAELKIKCTDSSLFDDLTAKIEATKCMRMIRNSAYIGTSSIVKTSFLPYSNKNGYYHIALNDIEILKILILNQWTKGKNGIRLQLKEYPTSLRVSINTQVVNLVFDVENKKTPYLMFESHLEKMKNGERLIQNIIF